MAGVIYTDHLSLRLKIRKIPNDYPRIILREPDQTFFDTVEQTHTAIKKHAYNGKTRCMMIAFERSEGDVRIITIHPIQDEKIIRRIKSGRWLKNG